MNAKKLITFLLLAFLPVMGIGLAIHFAPEGGAGAIITGLLTTGCMLVPLLAVILTQLIFKERILGDIGLSFISLKLRK